MFPGEAVQKRSSASFGSTFVAAENLRAGPLRKSSPALGAVPSAQPLMLFSSRSCFKGVVTIVVLLFLLFRATEGGTFEIWKNFSLYPVLEWEVIYDDNIFLSDLEPVGCWIAKVKPALATFYRRKHTLVLVNLLTEFDFYTNPRKPNTYARNNTLSLAAEHRFDNRNFLSLSDSFLIGSNVPELSESAQQEGANAAILPGPRDFRYNTAEVSLLHRINHFIELVASVEYEYTWLGAMAIPEPLNAQETHWVVTDLQGSYRINSTNSVSASAGFSWAGYTSGERSTIYWVALGDSWVVTPWLTVEGAGGLEYLRQTGETERGGVVQVGPYDAYYPFASLRVFYRTPELNMTLSGYFGLRDSALLSSAVLNRAVYFYVFYSPLRDFLMRVSAAYIHDSSADQVQGRAAQSLQSGLRSEYKIFRWLSIFFQYNFIDQKAIGVDGLSYVDNRFTIGAKLAEERRSR